MRISLTIGLFVLALVDFFSIKALAIDPACIKNTVVRGDSCNKLVVNFDFSSCGDAAPKSREVRSTCVNQKAVAFVKSNGEIFFATYAAPIKEGGDWRFLTIRSEARSSSPEIASAAALTVNNAAPAKSPGVVSENIELKPNPPPEKEESAPVAEAVPEVAKVPADKKSDSGVTPKIETKAEAKKEHEVGCACDMEEKSETPVRHKAFVDLYYMASGNSPALIAPYSTANTTLNGLPAANVPFRQFDTYSGSMSLALAELTLQKDFGHAGGQIDLGFGNNAAISSPNDIAGQNVLQAKVYYQGDFWKLTVGKLFTHITLEEPYSKEDINYSRSLLFTYAEPLWHMGAALEFQIIPKQLSATVYAYNSWSGAYQTNQPYNGLRLTWRPTDSLGFNYNDIVGTTPTINGGLRQEHEINATWKPAKDSTFSAEYIWGYQTSAFVGKDAQWSACELMAKRSWGRFSLAPRIEYFFDPQGYAISGVMGSNLTQPYLTQNMMSATITGYYQVEESANLIVEVREDSSDVNAFLNQGSAANSQTTGTVAFTYEF